MSTLVENVQKVKNAHAALSASIEAKGVSVPAGTKLTDMPALVEQISTEPAQTDAKSFYRDSGRNSINVQNVVYVDFTKAEIIPECFSNCSNLTSLVLPAGFGEAAKVITGCFRGCSSLSSLVLPETFGLNSYFRARCFYNCSSLQSLTLPDGFGRISLNTSSNTASFDGCSSLTTITGVPQFCTNISFSNCPLTHDSLMNIINGLQTVTTTQKLTLGSTNLAKLTDAEKQIATDKGWTLA